jgi:hypothetical protein
VDALVVIYITTVGNVCVLSIIADNTVLFLEANGAEKRVNEFEDI